MRIVRLLCETRTSLSSSSKLLILFARQGSNGIAESIESKTFLYKSIGGLLLFRKPRKKKESKGKDVTYKEMFAKCMGVNENFAF